MTSLNINQKKRRFDAMVGVGGVGSGSFFALSGNHTLGREESRKGRFLDRRDYCKLHIISHYVQTILGQTFSAIPIAKVGDDQTGRQIYSEMEQAGITMKYVDTVKGSRTLFSFCFVYPDGSGGNMTVEDSACSQVNAEFVETARELCVQLSSKAIVLAVPEVPIEARAHLLALGTEFNMFRIASFTSEELKTTACRELLRDIDLLAINVDEAASVAELTLTNKPLEDVICQAIEKLYQLNPHLWLSITAGASGSWAWDGANIIHVPAYETKVVNTAGAGDAHLAGLIVALTAGLPLSQAQQLAALTAALSAQSEHTINENINTDSLREFAQWSKSILSKDIKCLLGT